jgi:predicted MFS family arabinose efflux permease
VLTAWAVDRSPDHERANAGSTSVAFREMGGFIGATVLGVALQSIGQAWAFTIVSAVLVLGIPGALLVADRRPVPVPVPSLSTAPADVPKPPAT